MMIVRLIMVLLVMLPAAAYAAHPLITDDTGTQGKGNYQIEVTGEMVRDSEPGVKIKAFQLGTTLAAGVHKDIDIILGVPFISYEVRSAGVRTDEQGIGDVVAEAKWRFFEHDGLSLGLKPGVRMPTGDENRGLGAGKAGAHLYFIATRELDAWCFHGNIGYIRNENKISEEKDIWHLSGAAEYKVNEGMRLVGNIGMEQSADPASDNDPAFLVLGIIHSPRENIDLDAGVKFGLTDAEDDLAVLAGVTFRF